MGRGGLKIPPNNKHYYVVDFVIIGDSALLRHSSLL